MKIVSIKKFRIPENCLKATRSLKTGRWLAYFFIFFIASCDSDEKMVKIPEPEASVYRIPVVVHVIHNGEQVGEGANLSKERIEGQIRILNEDFRRKEGTPGYNDHPDSEDARIEFVFAQSSPDGKATDGIVRIDRSLIENPVPPNRFFDHYAYYSYWDPRSYLNIWTQPLPESVTDLILGSATGPDTDLPGAELLLEGEPIQAEGILINTAHFGVSGSHSDYALGRTLTHEVGHYLGLLHLWGKGDCETNDYCNDTPPVDKHTSGCPSHPLACNGDNAMVGNYMDYSPDACMHLFTKDQIARMHYVLKNSPYRKTLIKNN